MRASAALIGAAVLASCGLFGQTAGPPAFEVASVKRTAAPSAGPVNLFREDVGRVSYTNVTLRNVLTRAYDVRYDQIVGPLWLDSERYDIIAKAPDGDPKEHIPSMLQALLAERFQMTAHRENRDRPVYALVVGKTGPKLKKSDDSATPGVTGIQLNGPGGAARVNARGVTLSNLTSTLSSMLDRPVVDMTGIQGNYDITLELAADEAAGPIRAAIAGAGVAPVPRPSADGAPAPSIFTSIQQYGLKLEARKAPVEYVVVDKAEKVPTEN